MNHITHNYLNTMGNRKINILRIVLSLFFSATIGHAYADYGSIILHKAKFAMKNGTTVTGYVPLSNFDVSMEDYKDVAPDKAFQQLINKYYFTNRRTLEFKVYKKYDILISPEASTNPCGKAFFYTDSTSACTLNLDSIKYTVYINGQDISCLFWKQIEVFDLNTVELMAQRSIQYHDKVSLYVSLNYFVDAHIFCFNPNLSNVEFKEAIRDLGKSIKTKRRSDVDSYRQEQKALEKIGIVVFFWAEGSC